MTDSPASAAQVTQLTQAFKDLAEKVNGFEARLPPSKAARPEVDAAAATDQVDLLMASDTNPASAAAAALASIERDDVSLLVTGIAGSMKRDRDRMAAEKAQEEAFEAKRVTMSSADVTDSSLWSGFLQAADNQTQLNAVVRDLQQATTAYVASLPRGADAGAVATNTGMNYILSQLIELLRFSPQLSRNDHFTKAVNCIHTENLITILVAAKPPIDKEAATALRAASQEKGLTPAQLTVVKASLDVRKFMKGSS